jgi:hypothetical protein
LWASLLKRRTVSERATAQAWQQHLDTREELLDQQLAAINQHNADSQRALMDVQELYALAEARANTVIKQEEDLSARVRAVNEWA